MNFRTIADLNRIIINNIYKISKDVDLIVGIPRSGMLPALLISLYLNLPLTDFDSLLQERIYKNGSTKIKKDWINDISEARKILIVEDSSNSGRSLKEVREQLLNFKYNNKIEILTIFVTSETKKMTDLYFDICPNPRVFEWNLMHNNILKDCCVDIDGVLCEDPTEEQNDDGERYIDFIRNSPVKNRPSKKIGYLVTSRLEKYREETIKWLEKNDIEYDNLIMLNVNTKEERQKLNCHAIFKADVYKKLKDTCIFIESNKEQAQKINELTKKPVFCYENQIYYDNYIDLSEKIRRNIKNFNLKKLIPKPLKKFIKNILRK